MNRWIKIKIDVDETKQCDACVWVKFDKGLNLYCSLLDITLDGVVRCSACLAADVTDLVSENEALRLKVGVLETALNYAESEASLREEYAIENERLEKEVAMYKRAIEIMKEMRVLSPWIFNNAIKDAQAEQEASDA